MQPLTSIQAQTIHGGLTDKQTESLIGKVGAYTANSLLYVGLASVGIISFKAMMISAILAPTAKIAGTYVAYENKETLLEGIESTTEYFQSFIY